MKPAGQPLLSVSLNVDYPSRPGVLNGLELHMAEGEIVGLAGQSGCGKSTLALAIVGLLPRRTSVRGHVNFRGRDLLTYSPSALRRLRGKHIGMALQAAASALNPYLRLETQLREVWRAHETASWDTGRQSVLEALAAMDLRCDREFLRRYPREISVGQAQRVVLAMALLHHPALLIADEPTSALDVVAQMELLRLLKKVNRDHGTAILYISHDLATISYLCHRVCIVSNGTIVESGTPQQVFANPVTDFTRSLAAAHRALSPSMHVGQPA